MKEPSFDGRYSFHWAIEEFMRHDLVESRLFAPLPPNPVQFLLQAIRDEDKLYDGENERMSETQKCQFFLKKVSEETVPKDLKVKCKATFTGGKRNSFLVANSGMCTFKDRTLLFSGYFKHYPNDNERFTTKRFRVAFDDVKVNDFFLDVHWDFEFYSDLSITKSNTCLADLRSLYESKELSDVSINIGTNTLMAHKSILAARSPVFKAMFSNNFIEAESNCIEISDTDDSDTDAMDCFLKYSYCGDIDIELCVDTICRVYKLANKYQVADLSKFCSNMLAVELSSNNALQIVVFADLHKDALLKERAVFYILQHLNEIVSQTAAWKSFSDSFPDLYKEILKINS